MLATSEPAGVSRVSEVLRYLQSIADEGTCLSSTIMTSPEYNRAAQSVGKIYALRSWIIRGENVFGKATDLETAAVAGDLSAATGARTEPIFEDVEEHRCRIQI